MAGRKSSGNEALHHILMFDDGSYYCDICRASFSDDSAKHQHTAAGAERVAADTRAAAAGYDSPTHMLLAQAGVTITRSTDGATFDPEAERRKAAKRAGKTKS